MAGKKQGWDRMNRKIFERTGPTGKNFFDAEDIYKDPTGKYYKMTGTSRDMGLAFSKIDLDLNTFMGGDSTALKAGRMTEMSSDEFDQYMNPPKEKIAEDKIMNSWLNKAKGLFGK